VCEGHGLSEEPSVPDLARRSSLLTTIEVRLVAPPPRALISKRCPVYNKTAGDRRELNINLLVCWDAGIGPAFLR
jgi:hypothetical protein